LGRPHERARAVEDFHRAAPRSQEKITATRKELRVLPRRRTRANLKLAIGRTTMKALRTLFVIVCITTVGARVFFDPPHAWATGATLVTSPDPVDPGGRVEATGSGFCPAPCSSVTLRVDSDVVARNIRVDARGRFSTAFTAPFSSGNYTLRATQTKGNAPIEADASLTIGTKDVILSGPVTNQSPRTTTPPPTSPPASSPTSVHTDTTTRSSTTTTRHATSTTQSTTSTTSATSATGQASQQQESSDTSAWPWVAGAAALVAVVAAALLLRRRGRRSRALH
jgi:hypothetical protein